MSINIRRVLGVALTVAASAAFAAGAQKATFGFGATPPETELVRFFSPLPDGRGLPKGSGSVAQGKTVYEAQCVACHGEMGKGGISAALVGGGPLTTISGGQKTIANFWPYPTTVFDIIRRAMPWQQPKSLTNDEVYALTAYIFALNKLIGEDATMNAETLPAVRMPNRDGFIVRFPEKM